MVKFENERGINMKNDRFFAERRQHRRYQVKRNAYALLRNEFTDAGQITEISLGGMVFRYIYRNRGTPLALKIDILLLDLTDAAIIRNLHIRAVSDRGISQENPIESTQMKKQVVRFGSLTPIQTSRLKNFIRFYATGSV